MTQTDAYPLNERQLELVFNLPYYAALYMFKEPLTPSEVARRLRVPANVMHYRVKQLLEAGLLEVADGGSRSRTYKTVAQTFSITPEVLPAVTKALPAMLDGMLGKLHRNFLGRVEAELGDIEALLETSPIVFELNESLILGTISGLGFFSYTQPQHGTVPEDRQLGSHHTRRGRSRRGERCTLAFLAFQGEGAM